MIDKVLFLGSKNIGYSVLEEMYRVAPVSLCGIVTLNDTINDMSYVSHFKLFAASKNIPIHLLDGPKGLKSIIKELKPKLIVVVGWYWIIPSKLIKIVENGIIGIHGSLLPKYRGFSPFVWALINGETKTGLSLFYFSNGIDDGDIIAQKEIPLNINIEIGELLTIAEAKSIELINDNYKNILYKRNKRIPQTNKNVSYCSVRKPKDGIINWGDDNNNIYNFIRAQSFPYPGAFSYLDGELFIFEKVILVEQNYYGVPGVIAKKTNKSIIVCCGKNAIEVINLRKSESKENIVLTMKFGKKFSTDI